MSYKIGLEVEFFATKGGKIVDASQHSLPHDGLPLIVEARGDPYPCLFKAVASLRGEVERVIYQMKAQKLKPKFANWVEKDDHTQSLVTAAMRRGMNKRIAWQNLHGFSVSPKNDTHIAAGLHISFTKPNSFTYHSTAADGYKTHNYNEVFDFLRVFRALETEFGPDIDQSERVRGFYEIKPNGRVEYRSLPATVLGKNFESRLQRALGGVLTSGLF